jgi:hypothetical protein
MVESIVSGYQIRLISLAGVVSDPPPGIRSFGLLNIMPNAEDEILEWWLLQRSKGWRNAQLGV